MCRTRQAHSQLDGLSPAWRTFTGSISGRLAADGDHPALDDSRQGAILDLWLSILFAGKDQTLLADPDHIVEPDELPSKRIDLLPVDRRTVGGSQVFDVDGVSDHVDAAMLAADARVVTEGDVAANPPESEAVANRQELSTLIVEEVVPAHVRQTLRPARLTQHAYVPLFENTILPPSVNFLTDGLCPQGHATLWPPR